MAADCHKSSALVEFGIFLLQGLFLKRNEQEAVLYFQKSVKKYKSKGKFWFGICLLEGRGIPKNFYRGLEMIRQANEKLNLMTQLYYSSIEPFRSNFS